MERSKEDHDIIEAYKTLLVEILGAVTKGAISLKDSEKVSTYLARAIDMFPKIESRGWEIQKKAIDITQIQNRKAFNSIKSLDEQIRRNKSDIAEKKILIEETLNSIEEKRKEIQHLTDECNNLLTEIIGQEKMITTTNY
jgi:chromosome segregation ATPase